MHMVLSAPTYLNTDIMLSRLAPFLPTRFSYRLHNLQKSKSIHFTRIDVEVWKTCSCTTTRCYIGECTHVAIVICVGGKVVAVEHCSVVLEEPRTRDLCVVSALLVKKSIFHVWEYGFVISSRKK